MRGYIRARNNTQPLGVQIKQHWTSFCSYNILLASALPWWCNQLVYQIFLLLLFTANLKEIFIITVWVIDPAEEENNCTAKSKQAKFPSRPPTNAMLDLWPFQVKSACGIPAHTNFQTKQASRHSKSDKNRTHVWNCPYQYYLHFIANPPKSTACHGQCSPCFTAARGVTTDFTEEGKGKRSIQINPKGVSVRFKTVLLLLCGTCQLTYGRQTYSEYFHTVWGTSKNKEEFCCRATLTWH